jgi:hypothetical protein
MPGIEMKLKKIPIKFEHFQLIGIFLMFKEHWVVPEKIHTPPPRRKFSLSEGGGRKNVLACPKGGEEKCLRMSEGGGEECGYVCLKV